MNYRDQLDELLENPNPLALVTAAHLLTQHTRGDHAERYAARADIAGADPELILEWSDRILDAETLRDVLH